MLDFFLKIERISKGIYQLKINIKEGHLAFKKRINLELNQYMPTPYLSRFFPQSTRVTLIKTRTDEVRGNEKAW